MAKIDFPKKQEQRLIPKYLLEYAEELQENHPDPSAEWGGGGTPIEAGTGIEITGDETKTISIDTDTVALKTDIPDTTNMVTTNTNQNITGEKTFKKPIEIEDYDHDGTTTVLSGANIEVQSGISAINNFPIKIYSNGELTQYNIPASTTESKTYTIATTDDIPTNYVTTDTNQTITGEKTFTDGVR